MLVFAAAVSISLFNSAAVIPTPTVAVRPATVERKGDTVGYYGYLTAESVDRAIPLLAGATNLEIASPGGDNQSAIRLADAVIKSGVRVVVNGNCYSACAHYVFLAGKQKIVALGSLLLFHGTPLAWTSIERRNPQALSADQKKLAAEDVRAVKRLYRRLGISTDLLRCVDKTLGLDSAGPEAVEQTADARYSATVQGTATFAILTPDVLTHFGVHGIEYFWVPPPDQRDRISKLPKFAAVKLAWVDTPQSCSK